MSKRYIDADALLKTINKNPAEAHNERCAQILEAILYAPTADVEAVRHGEWGIMKMGDGEKVRTCSSCLISQSVNVYKGKVMFRYCPYCGAKMGEGRKDDGT